MKNLIVRDWMCPNVITINQELRIERAWEVMTRRGIRHLPVVKNARLVGIVTERDLKRALFPATPLAWIPHCGKPHATGAPQDLPVEAIMTKAVLTVTPTDPLLTAVMCMVTKKIGSLPVVNDAYGLVGIVTDTDLLKALVFLLSQEPNPSEPAAAYHAAAAYGRLHTETSAHELSA
ncbi:MAG: CBS domain-containing protein [Deltaproteobacteria bacterium]|nr:CBS domain-containing protein [Deltaproteobacteria bacterium]